MRPVNTLGRFSCNEGVERIDSNLLSPFTVHRSPFPVHLHLHRPPFTNKKPRTSRGFLDRTAVRLFGDHAHKRLLIDALLAELHATVRLREQGVVRAAAHVVARAINRAALAHDDVAGEHLLAAELLDTESLRL